MNELNEALKTFSRGTFWYLGVGCFLLVNSLSEFLPNFNGPIGMLFISLILLTLGYKSAKVDLAKDSGRNVCQQ